MNSFVKWVAGVLSTLLISTMLIVLNKVADNWWDNSQPVVIQSENNQKPPAEILKHSETLPIKISNPLDNKIVNSDNVSKCKADSPAAQIKCLDNPKAPFAISLWLDKPGKKRFKHRKKVKFGYQVNGLKKGKAVYLTLLNISPTGQISMLFSESIEAGKTYGNLKKGNKGNKGKNTTSVKEIKLKKGQEYFKAIVTFEPINLETFIEEAINGTLPNKSWKTVDLTVNVK